jgi:pimeloyl-ACP methyl ester carboxylesterase|nr:alpha/beta fold hydrolase [Kofleriaceae bacterium]
MPVVAIAGRDVHVQDLGRGAPVAMVHGLVIGSLASWFFTAAPVLAREHRVRMYDLRGHGKSAPAATGYDTRTLAGDLDAVTAELAGPFDVVGHSWGALVALRFAMLHPERVRRLAIVEAPLPPSRAFEMAAFVAADDQLPQRLLDALPASLRDAVAGGSRQAQRLLASVDQLVHHSSLLADVRAEPDPPDDALAAIGAPTLLAYGTRSACAPAGARLAAAIPGARLQMFDGGHYLHLDAKDALAGAIAEHLRG